MAKSSVPSILDILRKCEEVKTTSKSVDGNGLKVSMTVEGVPESASKASIAEHIREAAEVKVSTVLYKDGDDKGSKASGKAIDQSVKDTLATLVFTKTTVNRVKDTPSVPEPTTNGHAK